MRKSQQNEIEAVTDDTISFTKQYYNRMYERHSLLVVQEMGKESLKLILDKRSGHGSGDSFFTQHPEVRVVCVRGGTGRSKDMIKIVSRIISPENREDLENTYLYVLEIFPDDNLIRLVGGVIAVNLCDRQYATFCPAGTISMYDDTKISPDGEHWIISRSCLLKDKFFDDKLYHALTNRIVVESKSDPNTKAVSNYRDVDENIGKEVDSLRLAEWIEQRGELLIKAHQIYSARCKKEEKQTMLRSVLDDVWYKHAGGEVFLQRDVSGFFCLAVGAILSNCEYEVIQWLIKQEESVANFRLDHYYSTEADILKIMRHNKLNEYVEINLSGQDLSESMELFKKCYPTSKPPTKWFKCHFTVAGIVWTNLSCAVQQGECILSYKHIQQHAIPRIIQEAIEKSYSNEGNIRELKELYEKEKEEEVWRTIARSSLPVLKKIKAIVGVDEKKNVKVDLVGEIEDCVRKGLMPPCYMLHEMFMQKNHHLLYNERFNFSRILLDCGFKKPAILSHAQPRFEPNMNKEKFYRVHGSMADRKKVDAKGYACYTMMSDDYINTKLHPGEKAGCPFKILGQGDLSSLLSFMGVRDDKAKKEIMQTATKRKEYKLACVGVYKLLHGDPPLEDNVTKRPENYFFSASKAFKTKADEKKEEPKKDDIKQYLLPQTGESVKRRHIDIEWDVADDADFIAAYERYETSEVTKSVDATNIDSETPPESGGKKDAKDSKFKRLRKKLEDESEDDFDFLNDYHTPPRVPEELVSDGEDGEDIDEDNPYRDVARAEIKLEYNGSKEDDELQSAIRASLAESQHPNTPSQDPREKEFEDQLQLAIRASLGETEFVGDIPPLEVGRPIGSDARNHVKPKKRTITIPGPSLKIKAEADTWQDEIQKNYNEFLFGKGNMQSKTLVPRS